MGQDMKRKFFQISSFKDLTWEDISMSLTAKHFCAWNSKDRYQIQTGTISITHPAGIR